MKSPQLTAPPVDGIAGEISSPRTMRQASSLRAPTGLGLRDGGQVLLTARARLWIAATVLMTLLIAAVATVFDLGPLRTVTVSLFLLVELGIAPILLIGRISVLWFALLSVVTSLATTTSIGFVMSVTHLWYPVEALGIVITATILLLALSFRRDLVLARGAGRETHPAARTPSGPVFPVSFLTPARLIAAGTAVGLILVIVAAASAPGNPSPGGLFRLLGPAWYLGLGVIVLCVVVAYRLRTNPVVPIVTLSAVVVLSQAITYGTPAVMSAARHIGIVSYIRVNQGAQPELDIYQAWSGLFAGIAWLCDAAGIADPIGVATWWPVLLSPALTLGVAALASRWLSGPFRIWFAAVVFTLTSTLNIIYFSPQSVGLLFSLTIFALAVVPRRIGKRGSFGQMRPLGYGRLGLIFLLSCAMAVSHQISPYLTVAGLVVLALFGYVRPWWTSLLVLAPALGWAALNWGVLGRFIFLGAIGRFWENLQPPEHTFTQLPIPLVTKLTFYGPALFLVIIGVLAIICVVRVRTRYVFALLAAAASSVSLFAVTNYGQEGVFRVSLFAAPWLAILVAGLAWRGRGVANRHRGNRWWPLWSARTWTTAGLSVTLVALLGMNVYGQTALDWNRVMARDTVEALNVYEATAPDGAMMMLTGTGNATPQGGSSRYLSLGYLSREALGGYPSGSADYDADADVVLLTKSLVADWPATRHYALISESIGAYDERYGFQSYAHYQDLSAAMAASGLWVPIFTGETTTLYQLRTSEAPIS
ncbi:hypothetical protein [Cryobacterium sp. Y29]|uniref:hypothetical protein n=1 Tax=Cryobacterium sp. Y29 TaxID=2048285 RepID=UPI000CE2CC15|nr:hypothetical protein [Cryobacterium sp. Y29]